MLAQCSIQYTKLSMYECRRRTRAKSLASVYFFLIRILLEIAANILQYCVQVQYKIPYSILTLEDEVTVRRERFSHAEIMPTVQYHTLGNKHKIKLQYTLPYIYSFANTFTLQDRNRHGLI